MTVKRANYSDLPAIREIYNEGIEDRIATLETEPKTADDIADWWNEHDARYAVLVCSEKNHVIGWASLNRFSHRCAHSAIADLSVYVARAHRGRGLGYALLTALEAIAVEAQFHKIVLHALNTNEHGKRLYRKCGFVEVGIFKDHGMVNDRCVDVIAMEKILSAVS